MQQKLANLRVLRQVEGTLLSGETNVVTTFKINSYFKRKIHLK